jgi:hypothetical protein
MAQFDFGTINPVTKSGSVLATDLNSFRDALNSMHSGLTRPTYAVNGTVWLDTSGSRGLIKYYDGQDDIVLGAVDTTNNLFYPRLGAWEDEVLIVSAGTTDLGSTSSVRVTVSGSVGISNFGTAKNALKFVRFTGAPVLTNSSALITPTGTNLTVATGAVYLISSDASGNWRVANLGVDAWSKAESNSRFYRTMTTPTALTSGQTIPNTESGGFYSMALPAVQTCALPSVTGLPDGFSVVLRGTGLPSGYATAGVNGNGKNILYRNSAVTFFNLIGNGEIFRFTWVSGLDQWLAECLQHPGQVRMSRTNSATTWQSGSTSFTPIVFDQSSGAAPFNITSSSQTLVPVIGVYSYRHRAYMSASAGGGTSGNIDFVGTNASNGAPDSTEDYSGKNLILNEDQSFFTLQNTRVLLPGNIVSAQYSMSVTTAWIFPGNNLQVITLVSR